ncbi:hypothetical protein Ahy_Scaffold6g108072 [Arachis hypogaea]|uniref:Protein FAR1-RELATED SEQUENCE n=1 Tax=Arachis hypogaea TaxID=3818 RepID=A0A444WPR4_ARAHY|nr:hypothetical protein Ahy_Scaffold6g108072 [Arachis hypogaea]
MHTSYVVDEKFVPKTLEEAGKFYKHYSKLVDFSTKIRNKTWDEDKIKNKLIVCSREGRWKSISNFEDIPFSWVKLFSQNLLVLNHSHPCCADQAEMLKQHRELSMFVCRTIETHEEAGIRPSKTYQSFVAATTSGITSQGKYEIFLKKTMPKNLGKAFDRNWIDFLRKYGLGGNKWLSELYDDRHIWIPVYLDHHFWVGMRSTQRIESMHSFFNKFITRNSSLRQFVKQYDNCLASREQAEREFDAADFHTVIPCTSKSTIEAQFQHVYTHEKFKEFQTQFRGKVKCITRSMHSTLGFITYEVIEQVSNSTFNKFVVTYDVVSRDVKCHCLLFEFRDILCRHSLSVLSFERVDNVAPKYILERWSKNIKRRHTHIKNSQDEPLLEPRSKRFDELVFQSHNICEFASESEELTGILHRAFDKVMAEMEEYQGRSKEKSLLTHEETTLSNVNDLQSPPRVKTRGRLKNRLGSNLEKKISNLMKKKKKTSPSELNLLDSESPIQSSSTLYNTLDMNYPREDCTCFRESKWLGESYCFRFPNHLVSDFDHFMKQKIWTILVSELINIFLHFN